MRRTLLAVAAVALSQPACLLQISQTAHPEGSFADARASAEQAALTGAPAHRVRVLVWQRKSQRLVRVNVPLGWARWALHKGFEDEGAGVHDPHDAGSAIVRRVAALTTEDLRAAGGLMVESADEDDGQRVLVWLR